MRSIAVIPGDNIGPEVIAEGLKVLRLVDEQLQIGLEFDVYPWGTDYYLEHGRVMPADGLQTLARYDAIYVGALGDPARIPDWAIPVSLIQQIRKGFQQAVNLRPIRLWPGADSPLANPGEIDLVVVRENTEGEYAGCGGRLHQGQPQEVATQISVFTRLATERVMHFAFDLARRRGRKKRVTSATKSNALKFAMAMWDEVFSEVAANYPDVQSSKWHVDALSMLLVTKPAEFDVVVASNLFGDILSEIGAAVQGGIGLAPGANLNIDGRYPSMFEPIHGSAPDIAGKGVANPIATILAGAMMLDHLQIVGAARLIETAVGMVLEEARCRTPDMGGSATTSQMGNAICDALRECLRRHRH